MNILQIHKYYWAKDGASNYALYLSELLQKKHHKIIPFAMHSNQNIASPYEPYFVSERDLSHPGNISLANKIKTVAAMFYSLEAKRNMTALLKKERGVEIAHLHNIYHHISPSILPVLKKNGTKIVMTLHDYKLISPNYTMFHHGGVHEEDARGWYTACIKNKCMKNSTTQSAIVTAEMIWHHKIMKYYERYVDRFIAPSRFIMNTCIRFGRDEKKFIYIPHPIDTAAFSYTAEDHGYIAYIGRLSEEKGLHTLLDAAKLVPHIPVRIIGDGPLALTLHHRVEQEGISNITFTGFETGAKLKESIRGARLLVLPSIWYENYPLSILEAKAMGKIMLGSRIGGIPELLPPDLLFEPHNAEDLAELIKKWYSEPATVRQGKGQVLRDGVLVENDGIRHSEAIETLYRSL